MNILIVSTYPPTPCGIGKYTEQQVAVLRREGHRVDVLSPLDSEGDFQENLLGGLRPLRLLKYLWAYDDAYIHFTPHFFYSPYSVVSRMLTSLALVLVTLLMGRRVSFLIHETHYKLGEPRHGLLRHEIDRWYWRLARRVIFHSALERDILAAFYRLPAGRRGFEVWSQEKFLARHCPFTREQARLFLGLRPGATLLLCIGFIQPHKGYERAIAALRRVEAENLQLKIVGSVRQTGPEADAYAQKLHDMAELDPRCEIIESFLPDDLFDTWLVAADYILVPYHEIWTSAVAARAHFYERSLIAARTGALPEQLSDHSIFFSSDEDLVDIIRRIAAGVPLDPYSTASAPPAATPASEAETKTLTPTSTPVAIRP